MGTNFHKLVFDGENCEKFLTIQYLMSIALHTYIHMMHTCKCKSTSTIYGRKKKWYLLPLLRPEGKPVLWWSLNTCMSGSSLMNTGGWSSDTYCKALNSHVTEGLLAGCYRSHYGRSAIHVGLSFTLKVPEESVIHTLLLKVNSPNEQWSNMLPDLISYVHEQSMNHIALQSKLWQVT